MNKNTKTLLATIFLVAYLAVLLMFMLSTHHVPPGEPPGGGVVPGVPKIVHSNYVPFKTILPYLRGYPRWINAIQNLLGNFILLMPLGFLLPLLYRPISWKGVL